MNWIQKLNLFVFAGIKFKKKGYSTETNKFSPRFNLRNHDVGDTVSITIKIINTLVSKG